MADWHAMTRENIATMNRLEGFDVVIVCTGTALQASYWQSRLDGGKGSIVSKTATIVAVDEDWVGGAGNGKKCGICGYCIKACFVRCVLLPGLRCLLSTLLLSIVAPDCYLKYRFLHYFVCCILLV
jgi:hypothetical protein